MVNGNSSQGCKDSLTYAINKNNIAHYENEGQKSYDYLNSFRKKQSIRWRIP